MEEEILSYQRRYGPRPRYEVILVEALVGLGFQIHLSSDKDDERGGFDAVDTEFNLRIDFHEGIATDSPFLIQKKLGKERKGITVFHIPARVMDDLCCPSSREVALDELWDLYDRFITAHLQKVAC